MKTLKRLLLILNLIHIQIIFSQKKTDFDSINISAKNKLCDEYISKAKKDLTKFNGVYIKKICLGCKTEIFNEEIEKAVKIKNFKIFNHFESCIDLGIDNVISDCYESYIDTKMKEKFGVNYNEIIEKMADSILISKINLKNKIVDFDKLDEQNQPKLKIGNSIKSNVYIPMIKTKFNLKRDNINYAFLDLNFIIEKSGKISHLKISNWVNGFEENEPYKKELFKIAKNVVINEYNNWIAGKYKGNLVRVKNKFRISFE